MGGIDSVDCSATFYPQRKVTSLIQHFCKEKLHPTSNIPLDRAIIKEITQGGLTMRLEQLQYFISVATTGSLNKTSLEFYTTHQGISKAIRQLEDEMGAPLFIRSPKGMVLTQEGEMLLPIAERCVKDLHHVQLEIQHLHNEKPLTGLLQLYGTPVSNTIILPNLLDDFSVLYPDVSYQIDELNTIEVLRTLALHKNALGLIVMLHNPTFQDIYAPYLSQIQFYPVQQDEYVCVVSANSPFANYKSISFKEFAAHPVTTLLPDANDNHPLRQLLQRFGNTDIAFSTSTPRLLAQAITSGKYLAISSRRCRNETVYFKDNEVVAIPFDEDFTLDIMLALNTHPELDEISQAFVELVKERSGSTM